MISEYYVCYAYSPERLQEHVNRAIQNGWQPFGAVAVAMHVDSVHQEWEVGGVFVHGDETLYFCQVMVKRSSHEPSAPESPTEEPLSEGAVTPIDVLRVRP